MHPNVLMQKIRADLSIVEEQIRQHRYLDALERGAVSEQALRAIPGHQYQLMISLIRADAHMLHRFGGGPFRDYFFAVLGGSMTAFPALLDLAKRLGMDHEALEHYEVDPDGFAYACYVAWLADNGSPAELICGLSINLPAWGANCQRVSAALHKHYAFSDTDTRFFDGFAGAAPDEEVIVAAIGHDLACQVPADRIARAARLIQAYELRFWDAMAKAAQLP